MRLGGMRKLTAANCPHCGKLCDAASEIGSDKTSLPSDGDVTLCIDCGKWCVFTKRLSLRKPTDSELLEIDRNYDCTVSLRAWIDMNRERARQ